MAVARLAEDEEELLLKLVEVVRATPPGNDKTLVLLESSCITMGDAGPDVTVRRAGGGVTGISCYLSAYEALDQEGFVRESGRASSGVRRFVLTPLGDACADEVRARRGHPERVESQVRALLQPGDFADQYPAAWAAWGQAMTLLDAQNPQLQTGSVGSLCRDAVTAFAPIWCVAAGGACSEPPEMQIRHVSAGLKALRPSIGATTEEYLNALFDLWRTVIALVMRQSHARGKQGVALTEEDSRMAAFHTGLVMFELDRALHRTRP